MDTIDLLFGYGDQLNGLQMTDRGIAIFIISLILVRISGRRSFGLKTPLDNIVVILLGAILSRAVVGASPFFPTVLTASVIVLLHRLLSYLKVRSSKMSRMIDGEKIVLFEKGGFRNVNMKKGLTCKEDVMQGIRESALTNDLSAIDRVYLERNGVVSVVKKENTD